MFLRHKPSFLRPKPPISAVKVSSIIYHDQHPDEHYEPVTHVTSATWIATHRRRMSRQLAVIQLLSHYHIASLDGFYHIAHVHVAQPVATYHNATGIYLVYEYVDLDFREILPLSQPEIAALMHQAMVAVHHLIDQGFEFRINGLRISCYGVVKLVLDWNFTPTHHTATREAGQRDVADFLQKSMTSMEPDAYRWTLYEGACNFLDLLRAARIPPPTHPYLGSSGDQVPLRSAAFAALRKKSAFV